MTLALIATRPQGAPVRFLWPAGARSAARGGLCRQAVRPCVCRIVPHLARYDTNYPLRTPSYYNCQEWSCSTTTHDTSHPAPAGVHATTAPIPRTAADPLGFGCYGRHGGGLPGGRCLTSASFSALSIGRRGADVGHVSLGALGRSREGPPQAPKFWA